jgi:hypothetical protein
LFLAGEAKGICEQPDRVAVRARFGTPFEVTDSTSAEGGTLGQLLLGEPGRLAVAAEQVTERLCMRHGLAFFRNNREEVAMPIDGAKKSHHPTVTSSHYSIADRARKSAGEGSDESSFRACARARFSPKLLGKTRHE